MSVMESTAKVALPSRQQMSCGALAYAPRLPLLGLLNKISWLALYLLIVRVFSAAGFIVALWLCPVQVFANLGIYLASISLAALAVFGRYELLVVAAHDERQCADAVHLCLITGAVAIVAVLFAALAVNHVFVTDVALLFVASLFARAWLRLG